MPFRYGNEDTGGSDDGGLGLTNDEGTRILWGDVVAFVTGLLSAEFYSGLASFVETMFNAFLIIPIEGTTEWLVSMTEDLVGRPGEIVALAFGGSTRWVEANPFVGFVIALASIFALAYAASRVIPRG